MLGWWVMVYVCARGYVHTTHPHTTHPHTTHDTSTHNTSTHNTSTHTPHTQQAAGELGHKLTQEELTNLQLLLKYTLNNAHYYCETADITRPFPSSHPVDNPSWQFVWNRWLTASLRAAGLGAHAPPLLQGVAEGKSVTDVEGRGMTVALIARRSRLHPGMRYIARGLNSLASPGNEIECEQVNSYCVGGCVCV